MAEQNRIKYDWIIIGAGPAGYMAGIYAGKYGQKVLVIEKDELGGVCLNRGCIPSSFYYQTAEFFNKYAGLKEKKIIQGDVNLRYSELLRNKNEVISRLKKGIGYLFRKYNVEYIQAQARIISSHEVSVSMPEGRKVFSCDKVLIAAGSGEYVPDVIRNSRYYTGETVWGMEKLPESLGVIGGGVVGTEIALIFSQFGVKVILFEMAENILPFLDEDVVQPVVKKLKENRVRILTGVGVSAAQDDKDKVRIELKNGGTFDVDELVVSAGRRPELQSMPENDLPALELGFLKVDESYETSRKGIYALGDVINRGKMFAHLASYQAIDLMKKLHGGEKGRKDIPVPYGLFTVPQLAGIGLTEKELRAAGRRYRILKSPLLSTSMGKIADVKNGFLKLILSHEGNEVLGAHVVSEKAVELIALMSFLFDHGLQKDFSMIHRTLFLHPSESEVFSGHILELN
ncbi:MAG: NAD(P)/FAD-dependent oxidoreductase [bacterium]|nr:NAD(P)/FAD-dependent oxidoreductase [bacterium]